MAHSTAWLVLLLFLGQAWAWAAGDKAAGASPDEVRGVWLWSSEVTQRSAETVAEELARNHINKVFLLVKGASGTVCYPSQLAPTRTPGKDTLQETLEACHQRGIELHAWYVFNTDNCWGAKHPEGAMWHAGKPEAWSQGPYSKKDDKQRIPLCPLSQEYRAYFKSLLQEVLQRYPVDGIHLDYIRYGHVCYCFCPRHRAAAAEKGVSVEQVRQAVYDTFYAPRKKSDRYFSLYRAGDRDVVGWVNLRQAEIDSAVKDIRALVKGKKPSLALSAAFMPEGGEADDTFALCHYAQNYATAGAQLDYILPMTYGKSAQWIAQIARNAEQKSHRPVYSGLLASNGAAGIDERDKETESALAGPQDVPASELGQKVQTLRERGIKGFVLFRYGSMTDRIWKELPQH